MDGELVAFCEEERLINFKGAHFMFPGFAARWCLEEAGLNLEDIDYIAWGWDNPSYRFKMPLFFAYQFFRHGIFRKSDGAIGEIGVNLADHLPGTVSLKIKEGLRRVGLNGRIPKIEYITHHEAHLASTYLLSGFDEAVVLILDGAGENICTSVWQAKDGNYRMTHRFDIPDSLGWFYAGLTDYLGFIPYRDEGKVMGLAPYGSYDQDLDEKLSTVLTVTRHGYKLDPSYFLLGTHDAGKHYSDRLVDLLGPPRYYGEPMNDRVRDIAYATQMLLERAVENLVKDATEDGRIRNVCVAGGVGLNCKMNGVIRSLSCVDKVFVQPASSDAGSALGAAIALSHKLGEWKPFRLKSPYFGYKASDDEIKHDLEVAGVPYTMPDSLPGKIAEAISQGKIIAHLDGAMEFGARALGCRSILANPCDPDMKDKVNHRVKFRESWRPFCPSLLADHMHDYLEEADDAEFMIVAYQARERMKETLPSVVHVDNSVRPQTVEKSVNPKYWEILNECKALTGHPVLLNTSFNLRGQPIIARPRDAIACFFSCGLDVLVLNNYWVEKP